MQWKRRQGQGGKSLSKKLKRRNGRFQHSVESLENRLLLTATAYTWQNANIGAGGFVDGIFYDPNNVNVMYARTDIGGLYKSTNDGGTWQELLDFVGNTQSTSGNNTNQQMLGVQSFAIDPENSNNLYANVGQYTGQNGWVLYSTNGGQTWGQTNLSFYVGGNSNGRGDGEQIAVDPNDSNIVMLGSATAGLWESTNAGHSFAEISPAIFSPTSTTFVMFDPSSGTPGSPSQTIYVGIDSTSTGTNLFETTNGGTSWAQVAIASGTGPTGFLPGHAVISGGNIYLGYANAEAPNGNITNGGVFRYTPGTGAWANISPVIPSGNFGYDSVAADPNNPNTVVVTSFDYYSGPDQIWRTVNANAATPTWTELYDYASAQNFGYGGYDNTRDTSNAPWTAAFGDGISNWAATVAINPFNSNQLMYGTGQGIWATNNASNGGTNTQLTSAGSWYFPDTGIEFTAVLKLAAAPSGTALFAATGDINGFANTTLTESPSVGAAVVGTSLGTMQFVDFAGTNPNDDVMVGSTGAEDGQYSTNDGATWTEFATKPSGASNGTIAVTSTGGASMVIVWDPSGKKPSYSTNNGTTWTASTLPAGAGSGGQIVADRQNPSDFYYYAGANVYFSSNGGVTFTLEGSGAPSGGNIAVNPFVSGDLWIAASGGVYHSSNFGATFTKTVSSLSSTNSLIALGAPAPGQTIPAIYVFGTLGGFLGVYRSDDGGSTWTQINDVNHQWGGLVETLAADPNDFGRVYIGVNGRGIIVGNPASSLPAGWVDSDVNTPGNPGWATSSTTLSNGTTVNQWTVAGGGGTMVGNSYSVTSLSTTTSSLGAIIATAVTSSANGLHVGDVVTIAGATPAAYDGTFGITSIVNSTTFTYVVQGPALAAASGTITASTSDQFNFAYQPFSGDAAFSAQLVGLTNADGTIGTPEAGLMIRAGTGATDVFASIVQTAAGSLIFSDRATTGGSVTTATITGVPVGSEYIEIVRSGDNFSGFYSSDGMVWNQLGSTVAIAGMPTTANLGMVASADFNSQLTTATFNNVTMGPTLTAFKVNDGVNPQRSMVDSLTLVFSQMVTLGSGAISLNLLTSAGPPWTPVNFSLNSPDGGTTWVLTFTDPSDIGGSLPNGAYGLTVTAADVSALGRTLSGGDQNFTFTRLFGDVDGNGLVNATDFAAFGTAFGTVVNANDSDLDYNADGFINATDYAAFGQDFGKSIVTPSYPAVSLPSIATVTNSVIAAATLPMPGSQILAAQTVTPVVKTVTAVSNVNAVPVKHVAKKKPNHGH